VYVPRTARGSPLCNYPPITIYVLRGVAAAYDLVSPPPQLLGRTVAQAIARGEQTPAVRRALVLYKLPAVLADVALGAMLFLFLAGRFAWRPAAAVAACYVLIPAVIHNSAMWGQVDALPTLLVVASLEMARRRRLVWMTVLATLAVLTKAQTAAMAPLWLAVSVAWCLCSCGTGFQPVPQRASPAETPRSTEASRVVARRCLILIGTTAAVLLVVLFPFRHVLDAVWCAYIGATSFYPFTHLNGFSAWFLGAPMLWPHLHAVRLTEWYLSDAAGGPLGMSLRHWGMFGVVSVWGLVLTMLWRRRCDDRSIRWAARVLPLAFFVLSTQMHERYLFQALAIWAWSFVPTRRCWVGWVILAAAASINAFWAWPGPAGAAWVPAVDRLLHRTWLGLSPGVWCSAALIGLLALCLIGWFDGLFKRPG